MQGNETERPVLTGVEGRAGIIRLNRPRALNALTPEMVRIAQGALTEYARDPAVSHIVLEGAGDRAFCAGGDIRYLVEKGKEQSGEAEAFWRDEYRLIHTLANYSKPVIALMDGIIMGGGAGLAMHVSHRIVTDNTRFAMPEVGIGFLPDVGATYRLARAQGETGRYLALTGETVGAADVIHAGLADHHIRAERLGEFRNALLAADASQLESVIEQYAEKPEPGLFETYEAQIEAVFRHDTVNDIVEALTHRSLEFSKRTLATILSRSPRSLLVTSELLRLGRTAPTLEDCLTREYHAACRCLSAPDYYEGVRAAVIDKDRNPKWSPATLAEAGAFDPEDIAPVPGVPDPVYS
ncbi:enoyl-CoA hydratase/isomerase family protein [Aureimonas fodinaquatilis]|uniref:3-hydroxyisobutyryl-CoA hydrolase n=1 Tax=Aureimonas fodinaquatilis TaxID=2565783 RepID=A0A5B0E432_9HYPH|nr:enoyl-CoA hydratase/isomerase family protein [Aureimonas fodinaquatilis]KAA0972530.1 enoyl-CoA hydratase/isomerase family protein [Aureimonas fodinaquatilis]